MNPVVYREGSQFFAQNSFSASSSEILTLQTGEPVHYSLGTSAVLDDAMYEKDVNDVACTNLNCNKRISYAGPERSAGRPAIRPLGVN